MSERIPEGWTQENLSYFCKGIRGVSYKPNDLHRLPSNETVTLLRSNNIQDSGLLLADVQLVDKSKVKPTQLARSKDIAVCMSNGSRRLVGKSSSFHNLPLRGRYTVGAFCSIFRPTEEAIPDFVGQLFKSNQYIQQVELSLAGSAINNLKNSDLEEYKFLYPPKSEQQKITSILTSADEVIVKTEAQISKLQDLKKGMMQDLLTKGISHAEFKDSPVGRIPKGWDIQSADTFCSKITKGTTPPKKQESEEKTVPFIRVNNLGFDNNLHFDNGLLFVTDAIHRGFLSRSIVYPDDILMNIVGPPLGKIAKVPDKYAEYNINQAIIIYRVRKELVFLDYFLQYLGSNIAQEWFENRAKKTSGQKNLTIELCKDLPVPIPPKDEQLLIASSLNSQDKLIKSYSNKLSKVRGLKKALMQDLLTGKVRVKTD